MTNTDQHPTVDCDGILVHHAEHLDGGGNNFGKAYIPFIQRHFASPQSILEWCCGPGYIGFSLLARGLCHTLSLADINEEATAACRKTVQHNHLTEHVSVFRSDCFDDIPTGLRWDLIVGNPPHVNTKTPGETDFQRRKPRVIYLDQDWDIHRRFYKQAPHHLKPGGNVILQEKYKFSRPETFQPMITDSGLSIVDAIPCEPPYEEYYFLWSRLPE
ncbi:methyltransferase [Amycolatopsis anabasis]|uniref:methyltransferase n=1 Tax=Amycolatopsis anabasis TaxID=1840409 RepID=UPI00131C7CD3|nr:class I SAM-dependent methyltransferase [Amycolatopsis anabasis]